MSTWTVRLSINSSVAGSIADRLRQFGKFKEPLIRKFAIQILDGLIDLHSQQIVHRDPTGANILSDQKGNIKLADFGASRWSELSNYSDTEFCNSMKGYAGSSPMYSP